VPYISRILGSKVLDSADEVIGRLDDVVIEPKSGEYVPLKFLAVKSRKGIKYVPYRHVENFSHVEVSLKCPEHKIDYKDSIPDDFLFLKKHVLDHQIVDISGARVVRVNDLRIGNVEDNMCVLGVDVSTKGLLRRLGLDWLDVFNNMQVNLIDWRKSQSVGGKLQLDTVSNDLTKLHPADLANIIEDLNTKHGGQLVESLDAKSAAQVLEETDTDLQKKLIKYLGPKSASQILKQMSTEEVVDLIQSMPENEAKKYLSKLNDTQLEKIKNLSGYSSDTAGGLMSIDFVSVKPDWSVSRAINEIKKLSPQLRSILYLYVVDSSGLFMGTVSMRWLIISDKKKTMRDLLKPITKSSVLKPSYDIKRTIETMVKYDLYTAAVTDKKFRLLGIVCIDDVMRNLFPHA